MVHEDVIANEDEKGEHLVWSDVQTDYLVQCMLEQARIPRMKVSGGLKGKALTIIEKKMLEKFGPDFTKDKIRNKLKYVKPNLKICREIMNTSGFSWDPIRKCIDVDDSVWRDYIQHHPDRRKFRNASKWKYYEEFLEIYGDFNATGESRSIINSMFVNDSNQSNRDTPLSMPHEENQSFTSMTLSESQVRSPNNQEASPVVEENNRRRSKRQKQSNDAGCMQIMSKLATNMQTHAESSRATQISTCSKILKEMRANGEIDVNIHLKALDLLEDVNKTLIFMNLDPI